MNDLDDENHNNLINHDIYEYNDVYENDDDFYDVIDKERKQE
jgi:hypothetical protein